MTRAEEITAKRATMIEHLEAAHALADAINDGTASLMIELALAKLAEDSWPKNVGPSSNRPS